MFGGSPILLDEGSYTDFDYNKFKTAAKQLNAVPQMAEITEDLVAW